MRHIVTNLRFGDVAKGGGGDGIARLDATLLGALLRLLFLEFFGPAVKACEGVLRPVTGQRLDSEALPIWCKCCVSALA